MKAVISSDKLQYAAGNVNVARSIMVKEEMCMFFTIMCIITIIDLLIPDPVPFLDELALMFLTALSAQAG